MGIYVQASPVAWPAKKAKKRHWFCKPKIEGFPLLAMPHYLLFLLSIIIIIYTLIIQRKHLLISLLCLEGLILTLTPFIVFTMGNFPQNNTYLFIILLTFGACEASLGLSLLVSITRMFGNDLINLLTRNKC